MIILVDVDDTLAKTMESWIKFYNNKHKTKFEFSNVKEYDFAKAVGKGKEEIINDFREFGDKESLDSLPPLEDSVNVIKELSGEHTLLILTARPKDAYESTVKWVKKNYGLKTFKEIHVLKSFDYADKGSVGAKFNADVGIDDSLIEIESYVRNNIHAILINQPWNQGKTSNDVTRVNSWKSVTELVSKIKK